MSLESVGWRDNVNKIADYKGRLLNHVEAVYRPGERELAIEMAQALGLAVTDTGFRSEPDTPTFLGIHPNPDDCDPANNVFYVSEMTREHQALDRRLNEILRQDSELSALVQNWRHKVVTNPMGVPHFGVRYRSLAEVQAVERRINELAPRLQGRILNIHVFKPTGAEPPVTQSFLYQDVILAGPSALGQAIELQTQLQQ
jgi:hypothetical protein